MFMKEKHIAIASIIILIIGTFLPILSTPFGSINFFSDEGMLWDGIIFILLAILWIFLFFKNYIGRMRVVSALVGILTIFDFFVNYFKVSHLKNEALIELNKTPFGEAAVQMISGVGLSWGWLFIIIGTLGMIYVSYKNMFFKQEEKK